MTALMFNDGLGLFNSSLNHLSGQFSGGSASLGQAGLNSYVNGATGNLILNDRDEILVGRGIDIIAERTYNSLGDWNDSDENGWRFGFERSVELVGEFGVDNSEIIRHLGDGHQVTYQHIGDGVYESRDGEGNFDQIKRSSGNYIWQNRSTGATDTYNSAGQLISSADKDGNSRSYSYLAGKIEEIRLASGESMLFTYHTSGYGNDKLASLKTSASGEGAQDGIGAIQVNYTYDSSHRLYKITTDLTPDDATVDSQLYTTTYLYDDKGDAKSSRVREVSQSDGTKVSFTYVEHDDVFKVETITDGSSKLTYGYGNNFSTVTNTHNEQWRYEFDDDKRLLKVTSPDAGGRRITEFSYDADNNVTQSTNSNSAGTERLSSFYSYDDLGNRTSHTDAEGNRTEWRYAGKQLVSESYYPVGSGIAVESQGTLELKGNVWRSLDIDYTLTQNSVLEFDFRSDKQGEIHGLGFSNGNAYSAASTIKLWGIQNIPSWNNDSATYSGDGQWQHFRIPVGELGTAFSGRFTHLNLINDDDRASASSNSLFKNIQLSETDKSSVTHLDVTQLSSAPVISQDDYGHRQSITSRYVYDIEGHLSFTVSAEGRVNRSVYDGPGNKTASISYAGLFDVASLAVDSVLSDAQLTEWAAAQNKSATSRTDYFYNGRDQLVQSRNYSAVDSAGKGIVNSSMEQTSYTRDEHGQVLHSISSTGVQTSYVYDGMGRLISSLNADQKGITTEFAGTKITTTTTEGLQTVTTYDIAGRVSSVAVSADGSTRSSHNYYNEAGQLRMSKSATGVCNYFFYDAQGRQTATVDGDGTLSETKYNKAGLVESNTTYHTAVNIANWSKDSASILSTVSVEANTEKDRVVNYSYDKTGLLVKQTQLGGSDADRISETIRDDAGRITQSKNNARSIYYFYDNDGLKTAQQDNEGYRTEFSYNGRGQLVKTVRYHNQADSNGSVTADASLDHVSYQYYDGAGHLTASVNAMGYLTEFVVDNNGNKTQELHYNTALTSHNSLSTLASLRNAAGGLVSATENIYNHLGQLTETVSNDGVSTRYVYNDAGQLTTTTTGLRGSDSSEAQSHVKTFDGFGQVTNASSSQQSVSHEYDQLGRKISSVDGEGNKTLYFYDAMGHLTHTVNAVGEVKETSYNHLGEITATRAYAARLDSIVLTALTGGLSTSLIGKLTANNDLDTRTSAIEYNRFGEKSSVADANGLTTTLSYSVYGELVGQIRQLTASGLQSETKYVYDNRGLLSESTAGDLQVKRTYDAFGNQTGISSQEEDGAATDARGSESLFNKAGQARFSRNTQGYITEKIYNSLGQVSQSIAHAVKYSGDWATANEASLATWATNNSSVNDRITTNSYNAAGQLSSITDAAGYVESYTYDNAGNKISFTNKENNTWSYEYNSNNLLIKETSPSVTYTESGNTVTAAIITLFEYDNNGSLTKQTDAAGTADARVTEYSYDKAGRQHTTILPGRYDAVKGYAVKGTSNQSVNVTYNTQGQAVVNEKVLGDGQLRHDYKVYDNQGRVLFEVDADDYVSQYIYAGNATHSSTQVLRYSSKMSFSGLTRGQALSAENISLAISANSEDRSITRYFDAQGRLTSVIGSEITLYDLMPAGYGAPQSITIAPETSYEYNAFGEVIKESIKINNTDSADSYSEYNNSGQKIAQSDAMGYQTHWQYNAFGQIKSQTEYAVANRKEGEIGSVDEGYDRTTSYQYDKLGRQTSKTLSSSNYTYSNGVSSSSSLTEYTGYDKLGNVTSTTNAAGGVTDKSYDALGRVETYQDVEHQVAVSYSGFDVEKNERHTTDYYYNVHGDLVKQFDKDGENNDGVTGGFNTLYQLDARGSKIAVTNGDGVTTSSKYDASGQVIEEKIYIDTDYTHWGEGDEQQNDYWLIKSYAYDKRGNQTSANIAGSKSSAIYNAFGEVKQSGHSTANLFYNSYDKAGNLTEKTLANGDKAKLYYDLTGNVTKQVILGNISTSSDDRVTINHLDMLGRLTRQEQPKTGSGATPYITQKFDRWGNVIESRSAAGGVTRQEYNSLNKVEKEWLPETETIRAGNAVSGSYGAQQYYSYDELGNVVSARNGRGYTQKWQYDSAGLLQKHTNESGAYQEYRYDAFGNQVLRSDYGNNLHKSVYNKRGQVTQQGEIGSSGFYKTSYLVHSYEYDQAGRRISDSIGTSARDGRTTYSKYDGRGNIIASRNLEGAVSEFKYDSQNHKTMEKDANYVAAEKQYGSPVSVGYGGSATVNYYIGEKDAYAKTWAYDSFGNLLRKTDLGGHLTTYSLNAHKQALQEKTYTPDIAGQVANTLSMTRDNEYYSGGLLKSVADTELGGSGWAHLAQEMAGWSEMSTDKRLFGELKPWEVSDLKRIEKSSYDYDASGNRIVENSNSLREFTRAIHVKSDNRLAYKDTLKIEFSRNTRSAFDARGRLKEVASDPSKLTAKSSEIKRGEISNEVVYGSGQLATFNPLFFGASDNLGMDTYSSGLEFLRYSYDEIGNRRLVESSIYKAGSSYKPTAQNDKLYYTYDEQNRLLVSQGKDASGALKEGSYRFEYDALGRRVIESEKGKDTTKQVMIAGSEGQGPNGSPEFRTVTIAHYDIEKYDYIYGSSQLSQTSAISDAQVTGDVEALNYLNRDKETTYSSLHSVTSSDRYKKLSSRIYDSQGRLDSTLSYAQKDNELYSGVKTGDQVAKTVYHWDKGNRLLTQDTYKRAKNADKLEYVTTAEAAGITSQTDATNLYGAPSSVTYQQKLADAPLYDPSTAVSGHYEHENGYYGGPMGSASSLSAGTYSEMVSGLYKTQTGWNTETVKVGTKARTVYDEHQGWFVDYYNVDENKQIGYETKTTTTNHSGYFIDYYNVVDDKKVYTTHYGNYDQAVKNSTITGTGAKVEATAVSTGYGGTGTQYILPTNTVSNNTITSYETRSDGKWKIIKTPEYNYRDYTVSTQVFNSGYKDYNNYTNNVTDVQVSSTSGYNSTTYETRSGVKYRKASTAHFATKNWTTSTSKQVFNSGYKDYRTYINNTADVQVSSSSGHNSTTYQTRSGVKYRQINTAQFTTKYWTTSTSKQVFNYNYKDYRNYVKDVADVQVQTTTPYGSTAVILPYSTYAKTTYETRSGVKYKLIHSAHFVKKSWNTTETKQVYVSATYGKPAHYETKTVTTNHTGYFLDYYNINEDKQIGNETKVTTTNHSGLFLTQYSVNEDKQIGYETKTTTTNHSGTFLTHYTVNEDQQIGYETKTETKSAYIMDNYKVKEARQKTWQTEAWVNDKNSVNDITDKAVEVTYASGSYGSGAPTMPTAANTSTTYKTINGVEHRYKSTPHFTEKEWTTTSSSQVFNSAYKDNREYVKDITDKAVQVTYENNSYGSSTPTMPTASESFTSYETRDGVKYQLKHSPHFLYKEWQTPRTVYDDVYETRNTTPIYELMDYRFTTVVTNKPAPGQGWDWIKKSMVVYDKYDNSGNLLKNSVTSYKDRDYQSTYEKTAETQSSNKLSSSFEREFTYDVDFTETHNKTYAKFNGYQEQKDSLATTRDKWRASSMQSYFSATGELMYVRGSSDEVKGHDRYIVNNRDGQTLFRQDGTKRQEYYYSNGNSLGNTGTLSDTDFDNNYSSVSGMQQSATGMYTVQSGDSLQSIAKKVWGDASLWYMLADANGMTQSATLAEGQQLTLPAVNSNVHNNSDTFKPYNPSDVVGSTDAEAVAPPSPDGGCGAIGMILMVVVAVVVSVYTAGAASGLIGAALASGGTTAAAAGIPAAAVASATAASAAAISASTGAMLAAGAIGGMAGSLASQVVGNMTGNVKGINWKGVAQGGLAGLVGGLASGLGNAAQASKTVTSTLGQVALRSSAQVAGNYLVNKALYNQSFSWKGLAAGVAGSMAGSYAGDIAMPGLTTGAGQFAKNAFTSFAGGYTENRARVWMDVGGVRSTEQLLTDAFGNALGNSMAGVHVKAAEKERMKQGMQSGASSVSSMQQGRSFAGVGPIFDWRNKPMTYDFSGYQPIFDFRTLPRPADMANYGAILDYRSGDYDYSDTAMPEIGVCYADSPVYSASSTNGVEMRPAVAQSHPGRGSLPSEVGHMLGGASRLSEISQKLGTTIRKSVETYEVYDEYGQQLNAYRKNASTGFSMSVMLKGDLPVTPGLPIRTVLPYSSIYGPGGSEMLRTYGDIETSSQTTRLLNSKSLLQTISKYTGNIGDGIEFVSDTYNNFTTDGVSPRSFIATTLDGAQMLGSGVISTIAGTWAGAGAGTLTTFVFPPAAPGVALSTGVATGVYVDNTLDGWYGGVRDDAINGVTKAYNWIMD